MAIQKNIDIIKLVLTCSEQIFSFIVCLTSRMYIQFKQICSIPSTPSSSKLLTICGNFSIFTKYLSVLHIIHSSSSPSDFRFLMLSKSFNTVNNFWKHRGHHFKSNNFSLTCKKFLIFNKQHFLCTTYIFKINFSK